MPAFDAHPKIECATLGLMLIAMKITAGGDSPRVVEVVPSTLFACRECGQVFMIFLDSGSSSLKARMWLEAKLNDEHHAGKDQHNDVYSLPEYREGNIDTPDAAVQ